MMNSKLKNSIRIVKDFPKRGILFYDIIPILNNPELYNDILLFFEKKCIQNNIKAICTIESRGFLFASPISSKLNIPLIIIRKAGKTPPPFDNITIEYEYSTATLEISNIYKNYQNVAFIDDVLATGNTLSGVNKLLLRNKIVIKDAFFVIGLKNIFNKNNIYPFKTYFYSTF